MADDLIAISSGVLTARINPFGAELWSLTDAAGAQFMTDADPAFWTGHAPLLFPIVGALNGDRLRIDGRELALAKHGFARRSVFEVIEALADRATFRLRDSAATQESYPFAFILEVAFAMEGMTLHLTATVTNSGAQDLPFSFGYHPAFAWPLPGGADKAAHRVEFAETEPQPIRRIEPASGLVLADPVTTPVDGRTLALDAALFEPDAVIWDKLHSRTLSFGADGGSWLDIGFPDTPMLGIWQKPGAAYLCIEPWAGIADPVGFDGDFRDKPGIMMLPPGKSRSFRMDVTVRGG